MSTPALHHFSNSDPVLHWVYLQLPDGLQLIEVELKPINSYFDRLCESIVSQQLSVKASDTIWKRFIALFPDQVIQPASILETNEQVLRSVGLSGAKTKYIKSLAEAVVSGQLELESLTELSNEEVIRSLTLVKGIGQWTAEMFIMFTLGREDVFSLGDLGLRNAMQRWYGQANTPLTSNQHLELSQRWSPYRTYAAMILWRSLELPKTIVYNPTGAKR